MTGNLMLLQNDSGSRIGSQISISRIRSGETSQLGRLLESYRTQLGAIAEGQLDRKLRSRVSPSDIVQETMLEAYRDFGQFRGETEAEFMGWLRKILSNNVARAIETHVLAKKRDVRRDVSIRRLIASMDQSATQMDAIFAAKDETPSVGASRRESSSMLSARMNQLSKSQRQVVQLRNIEGLKFREIAVRMDRTEAAVKMLWLRAIKHLRRLMNATDE